MAGTSDQIRDQINFFFSRLTLRQKLIFFTSLAIGLAILLLVLTWTSRPNYDILFSNLSQKDAGKILEKLKEQKIDYKLENGGTTIFVPSDKVYELRLAFAQEGIPESSSVGYEIFDKTNLGMTDFIQQVNYRRALEGELARTIEQIESVEGARVHIVIPREALFKEDQEEPSASVILRLKGRGKLSQNTVLGISHLIASSVEGLEPENITIMDTRGRILSEKQSPNDLLTMSASQLELTRKAEDYLAQKAQSMLDQVIGPGNAVVRVTAELNFRQVEKNIEEYDPDNTAVVSEEIQEESNPVVGTTDTGALTSKHSSTLTNYEVNKTIQHIVEGVGNIERLSVAVMVNNKREIVTDKDGKRKVKYTPRSPKEMEMLTELVRTAVGFKEERGDQVSVVNIDFSVPSLEEELFEPESPKLWDNWYNLIEKIFLILAIIASMLIIRSLFSHVKQRNEQIKEQILALQKAGKIPQLPDAGDSTSELQRGKDQKLDEEVIVAEDFFKSLSSKNPLTKNLESFIKDKPDEAAKLLKVWLTEDENMR